jgi:hypothetical protein
MKDFIISQIGEEAAEEFALWAFGEGYHKLRRLQLMHKWNLRHRDLLLLDGYSNPSEDFLKMVDLWKKSTSSSCPQTPS